MGITDNTRWKKINEKLLEMEGKELEGEDIKEWNRLINVEFKMIEEEDEKQERKKAGKGKDVQTVSADMERKETHI